MFHFLQHRTDEFGLFTESDLLAIRVRAVISITRIKPTMSCTALQLKCFFRWKAHLRVSTW